MPYTVKYKSSMCKDLLDYFRNPPVHYEETIIIDKEGNKKIQKKPIIRELPLLKIWMLKHHLGHSQVERWTKKHPAFAQAVEEAKALQESQLIQLGLAKIYDTTFAMFVAKNLTTLRDRVDYQVNNGDPLLLLLDTVANQSRQSIAKAPDNALSSADIAQDAPQLKNKPE